MELKAGSKKQRLEEAEGWRLAFTGEGKEAKISPATFSANFPRQIPRHFSSNFPAIFTGTFPTQIHQQIAWQISQQISKSPGKKSSKFLGNPCKFTGKFLSKFRADGKFLRFFSANLTRQIFPANFLAICITNFLAKANSPANSLRKLLDKFPRQITWQSPGKFYHKFPAISLANSSLHREP